VLIQTGVAASLEARVRAEDVKEVLAILRNGTSLEEIENMYKEKERQLTEAMNSGSKGGKGSKRPRSHH
ncbi:MAG: hypothetical protein LBL76_10285, partial [Treponema sp.]|jgi:hypothetical protein|nr:hypothetical protein [Treponema sp.]